MSDRECAICFPRSVPCEGECEGRREATHEVITGRRRDHSGTFDVFKLMCHTCAVQEQTEKNEGHTDD
jgi:hypothetical protein